MSHVICSKGAGDVIKTYSPNLIVHPYLYESAYKPKELSVAQVVERVVGVLKRVHVLVVGPGMGRDEFMMETVAAVVEEAKKIGLPLVIDADGLFLIQKRPELIKGYTDAVLTPNVVEFQRLQQAVGIEQNAKAPARNSAELAEKLGGVTVLEKGPNDYISNGKTVLTNDVQGGLKRVSGQGDTLSGSVATFLAWRSSYTNKEWDVQGDLSASDLILLASFAGSCITRTASKLAFNAKGRAVLTSDLTDHVGQAFHDVFESTSSTL
jgi:ATP-dependent NAD(P)H-hydrate dehydratase